MATVNYECPNCGGALKFNPDKQMFSCEYCFSDFSNAQIQQIYAQKEQSQTEDERAMEAEARQKAEAKAAGIDDEGGFGVTYTCPTCGAEIVTSETTAATTCFYCQNPVVLGGRLSAAFKPDRVVPFALSKDKAVEKFMQMCGSKKFLPPGFASKKQFEKMQGVYFPYWYVDERNQSAMVATGKKTRRWKEGNRNYTETTTYRLYRTADIELRNVFKRALKSNDREMLQGVHPFDLTKAQPFAMSFLSGFQAEKRDLEKQDVTPNIEQRMKQYSESLLSDTTSDFESVHTESFNQKKYGQLWNYTLLPVWIVTYKFNGEILPFAINGQTGKTYGKLPIAKGKVFAVASIIAAACTVLGVIGGFLFR